MQNVIADYFKDQPILRAWILGSFARGEETSLSDVDLLVEYDKDRDRLEHILEAIDCILEFAIGKSIEDLQSDKLKYYGIVKNIENIGC